MNLHTYDLMTVLSRFRSLNISKHQCILLFYMNLIICIFREFFFNSSRLIFYSLALECYYENVYKGVRKETKSLHHCRSGTTCNFDDFHQKRLGCYYDKESRFAWVQEWDECSVSKCSKNKD